VCKRRSREGGPDAPSAPTGKRKTLNEHAPLARRGRGVMSPEGGLRAPEGRVKETPRRSEHDIKALG